MNEDYGAIPRLDNEGRLHYAPDAAEQLAADENAGYAQSTSTVSAGGVAFGTADRPISGTVVRKRPEHHAFRYGHDGVWTKWPSPKKEAWT